MYMGLSSLSLNTIGFEIIEVGDENHNETNKFLILYIHFFEIIHSDACKTTHKITKNIRTSYIILTTTIHTREIC